MHLNGNFQLITIMPSNQQCGSLGTLVTQSFMHFSKNSCRKNIQYVSIRKKSVETLLTTSPCLSSGQDLSVGSGT
jgi:hypothetical protein